MSSQPDHADAARASDTQPDSGPAAIEDYALISDLRSCALIDRAGSMDWLCLPRFDSASCFGRLLGDERHGYWKIAPAEGTDVAVQRRYRGTSLILETEFRTSTGRVVLTDSMPPHEKNPDDPPCVVRTVECLEGEMSLCMDWVLRFAYGDTVPWVRRIREDGARAPHDATDSDRDTALLAVAGPETIVLRGDPLPQPLRGKRAHHAQFTLRHGQRCDWIMHWSTAFDQIPAGLDPRQETRDSEHFWRDWTQRIRYSGPHEQQITRSLVTLKGLTFSPTGGIVAAPTTSLPETLGGSRNWDYRYCWLRDATMTLLAMDNFGCSAEAYAWRRWLLRAVAGDPADLQIMYGVGGERHLIEWEADWLPGYQGARPVRIGNAAFRQVQLDIYGEVMDALLLARERGYAESQESWRLQLGLMKHLEQVWRRKDKGLWEMRGPDRHFTHSRVMTWVAFDRAVRAVEEDGLDGPVERWRELRDAVHAEVCEHGWNPDRGAFTQYYGGTELDAATLLIPQVGFLPGDDERVLATIDAIGAELKHGDLVERYSTSGHTSDVDGLSGQEGAFLLCSFWFVDALALAGRIGEAEAMFERLLGLVNDVGLLAEEYEPDSGRFVGNFPQAFSHLGMVNSAAMLWGGHTRNEASRRGDTSSRATPAGGTGGRQR